MKTKILYVLVSTEDDIFAEQTYLSVLSLKRYNSSAKVALIMDNQTELSLKTRKFDLLGLLDESIVIDLPDGMSNKYKSRVLKTNMRNYIDGDFLYIDSDTIILSDLSDIDKEKSDLAAVYEFNRPFSETANGKTLNEIYKRLKQNINQITEYFNSGVIYVKDNAYTREFFTEWCDEWMKGTDLGILFDQPSLGIVNTRKGNTISALDGSWNCQGRYSLNYANDAKIYHYLFDKGFAFPLLKKEAFLELKVSGNINHKLEDIIKKPYKHISSTNIIITDKDVILHGTRLYAMIRSIYSHPWLFNIIEKSLNGIYNVILCLKKRKLAPPR